MEFPQDLAQVHGPHIFLATRQLNDSAGNDRPITQKFWLTSIQF
jgi:hypothetical protein